MLNNFWQSGHLRQMPRLRFGGARWFSGEVVALVGILLLALVLRLVHLSLAPFGAASAQQLLDSDTILHGDLLLISTPLEGISPQPPLAGYLYAIPLLFSRNPIVVLVWGVLLQIGAILLAYSTCRRWFGMRAAILMALVWAASPWAILQSRVISPHMYAPLLVTAMYCGLEMALNRRLAPGWLLSWLSAWLLLNLHTAYWPMLVIMAVISLIYWWRVAWRHAIAAALVGVALLIPYLYYGYTASGGALLTWLASLHAAGVHWGRKAFTAAVRIASGWGFTSLLGGTPPVGRFAELLQGIQQASAVVWIAALTSVLLLAFWRLANWNRRPSSEKLVCLLLLLGAACGALAGMPQAQPLAEPSALTPLVMMLYGYALAKLISLVLAHRYAERSWLVAERLATAMLLLVLLLAPVYGARVLLLTLQQRSIPAPYGMTLRFWQQTANATGKVLRLDGAARLYTVGGEALGADRRILSLRYLLADEFEVINLCPSDGLCLAVPLYGSHHLLLLQPQPEVSQYLEHHMAAKEAIVTVADKAHSAVLYTLPSVSVDGMAGEIPHRELWSVDDGALLLGWETPALQSAATRLATWWTWRTQPVPQLDHALAVRSYDTSGTLSELRREFGVPEAYWSASYVFVRWMDLPAIYQQDLHSGLQLGVYRQPDHVINRVNDEQADRPSTAITIRLSADEERR
ncbi:MAG: hypothetical protein GXY52_06550 [Chloroflexi bacterium]|nr:hypothetical protein [Chloroflexota bacterium]